MLKISFLYTVYFHGVGFTDCEEFTSKASALRWAQGPWVEGAGFDRMTCKMVITLGGWEVKA